MPRRNPGDSFPKLMLSTDGQVVAPGVRRQPAS